VFICPDAAKLQFPEYVADPLNMSDVVQAAAELICDAVLETVLGTPAVEGREIVLIAVGAPASGKTTLLDCLSEETVEMKIESTFDDLSKARSLLLRILEAGRRPVVLWAYLGDPKECVRRMFLRAEKIGRVEKLDVMARSFCDVPKVLGTLRKEFGMIVNFHVVDNSGEKGEAKFVEDVSSAGRKPGEYEMVRAALVQLHSSNQRFQSNPDHEVRF